MAAAEAASIRVDAGAVVVAAVLGAPRRRVWEAWTEPEQVVRWYGPAGMSAHVCEIDLRPGGRYLWGLRAPGGPEYYNAGVFREIVPDERLVATMCLADAAGRTVAASHYGMPGHAPSETVLSLDLADAPDGATRLTLRQEGWGDDGMAAGAGDGWGQALEKLARVLGATA